MKFRLPFVSRKKHDKEVAYLRGNIAGLEEETAKMLEGEYMHKLYLKVLADELSKWKPK